MIQTLRRDGGASMRRDFAVGPGRESDVIIENAREPRFDTPLPSAMHEFPASLKPEVEKWLENYLAEASTRRESLSEREVRRRVRMELDFEPRSAKSATGTRFPCYSLTNLMRPLQG